MGGEWEGDEKVGRREWEGRSLREEEWEEDEKVGRREWEGRSLREEEWEEDEKVGRREWEGRSLREEDGKVGRRECWEGGEEECEATTTFLVLTLILRTVCRPV